MQTDSNSKTPSRKPAEIVTNTDTGTMDYPMRRHPGESGRSPRADDGSLGQPRGSSLSPSSHAGQKRKTSSDRSAFPPVTEEIDPQLVGPGVHSGVAGEQEGPAPKRRGSAFDTQRIAQLSLYDRRGSVDARMGNAPNWWGDDRRDSTSSMFSSGSLGSSVSYSPGFSGDSHGRPAGNMATFAWPPSAGPSDAPTAPGMHEEVDPNIARQFEAPIPPHSLVTGMQFDRRMSAPEGMPSTTSARPERVLRSRSRPPSRATAAGTRSNDTSAGLAQSAGANNNNDQDGPPSATSSAGSSMQPGGKDAGSTPYSRSPELRVSHKLAERKRRKEMKDLFDELRDHLPADRGMKASKWEILSKAIDFIGQMKQTHTDMAREIEMLRHELEATRHGVSFGHPSGPPHPVVYGQAPPPIPQQYPPPGGPPQVQQPNSRPGSSQNAFPPNGSQPVANGKT
ncbi:hypothetical protein BD410DRAFT_24925 [Rickenella mellea]|uniref:BHLH domain-containing protein n=1 Tax=Rickenella mellea TaxID=50990 RepID=A0A4R5XGH5_9AGAM|nr:hypothetical protein BD410DRAFT_24925 [Rickenella mellea]